MSNKTILKTIRLTAATEAAIKAVADRNGREFNEQIDHFITSGLIAESALPSDEAALYQQRENLIRAYLEKAVEIYTDGHRDDIIAETARRMDAAWHADYAAYIKLRDRNTINPTLGRRVKVRLRLRTGKVYGVPQPHIFTSSSYLHPENAAASETAA